MDILSDEVILQDYCRFFFAEFLIGASSPVGANSFLEEWSQFGRAMSSRETKKDYVSRVQASYLKLGDALFRFSSTIRFFTLGFTFSIYSIHLNFSHQLKIGRICLPYLPIAYSLVSPLGGDIVFPIVVCRVCSITLKPFEIFAQNLIQI